MTDNLFKGLGVEIFLNDEGEFNILRENLTRIGIASKRKNELYQSVHVLKKKDPNNGYSRYALMHFKHLFKFDGRPTEITEDDIKRFNTIVWLVSQQWNLCDIKDESLLDEIEQNRIPMSQVKVLHHSEKKDWNLIAKYTIGKNKNYKKD